MDEEKPKKQGTESKAAKIAVIRIKGLTKTSKEKQDSLNMLRLYRRNYCVVIDKNPSVLGMIKKIGSYITWGEINGETLKELVAKRGEKTKKQGKELAKPFFRLSPPKGGFERKGIKTPFSIGGAAGYRGEKINDLIRRML